MYPWDTDGVPAPLVVAALVALAYAALIGAHARVIRRHRVRGAYEPRAALWLASRFGPLPAPADAGERLASTERRATDALLTGALDPAEYRARMTALAAQEARERPLRVSR
ncbi:hypothetical protein GCM10022255_087620 [Dactylosporangium darangshiense]|uniref:DUF4129 domain-containing protein n=1 Tax=Dactylosporangium darangshiense TaxID=579108 RepID=A0ABP8DN46_9ACTN